MSCQQRATLRAARSICMRIFGATRFKDSFQSPPQSLQADRGRVQYPPQLEGNALGRGLLRLVGAYSQKQQLANGASILYQAITEQSEDGRLYEALGLDPDAFMSTHSLLVLHMWLVINRLKPEDRSSASAFQQLLYTDHFYKDMERRVYKEGVQVHVSKWLKKLEQLTYGSWVAYDIALAGERSQLVDALVKNVYGGDPTQRPFATLAAKYLNRELACLQLTPIEAIYNGHVRFSLDVRKSDDR
ncbi:hypothetical protein MNEG_5407 [Monoraphidium neglectum]|uniref:Ubiquinol-cytochrome c chaperone domain-containing protein n=1 Tax=Monoraphidium neglectum TaxID=145388 RepID=A0A0D2MHL3_9CHLO|nr:hypothetical protein MNEG_5407 [Monoraphidium neglectum]KIZ02555.1 hypothetical protein MNEG_5407 [Monoraphidium neglectum]|eukprot:XP_013901574.1 hypothetical protein MNEG_5407 [Monoraphidium neglectum]